MRCPNCQADNPAAGNFCANCGARLPRTCPTCGAAITSPGRFCANCGAALTGAPPAAPPRPATLEEQFTRFERALPAAFREQLIAPDEGESRVITILFADLSGSVQAMATLPPDDAVALVNQVLQAMVDAILTYGGRINRMLGDGVLAFFGVPQAHEGDPERAIRAALELCTSVQALGLAVTVGINTGEVFLGNIGDERHREYTALGTAINLASRLQGKAQPGQILVGEPTYRQTRRAFEFTHQMLEMKGLAEPVPAYAVLRALPHPEKVRGLDGVQAELVGRASELTRLVEALDGARAGRGQFVTLIGEAGLGKSRLVAELRQRAPEGADLLWLEGRCLEFASGVSYWPFLDALRERLGWRMDDDDAVRAVRLDAAIGDLVLRGALTERRATDIMPFLANLLAIRLGDEREQWVARLTPEQLKHQTLLALVDTFTALAHGRLLALILEDLHWADSLSLDVLSLLMDALRHTSLLLVCVYRPERDHRCWRLAALAARKCPERHTEITLRELAPAQGRRLIESLLHIDQLPEALKTMIVAKAQGNPFFVEEVIRSLIDAKLVYREAQHWRTRSELATVAVPATVQGVILSRVDRLEEDTKRVLQSAAVIGQLFGRRLLEYMTRQEASLERALDELEERELIYQERVVPEEAFSFRHVLTQETVYGGIVRRRRMLFHRQVAEGIEGLYGERLEEHYAQLAYHYERSGVMDKAVEYLIRAGEQAQQNYANDQALDFFQRALTALQAGTAEPDDAPLEVAVYRGLGLTHHRLGNTEEAKSYLRQAIARGQERSLPPREVARHHAALGDILYWQRRPDDVESVALEGLSLLGNDRQSLEAVQLIALQGGAHTLRGDGHRRWELLRPVVPVVEQLPHAAELRRLYHFISHDLIAEKNIEEALRLLDLFERRATAAQDLETKGFMLGVRAFAEMERGRLREGIPLLQEAVELFNKIGEPGNACLMTLTAGLHHLLLGDLDAVEQSAQRAAALAASAGVAWYPAYARILTGVVALSRGRMAEADAAFAELRQMSATLGDSWAGGAAYDLARLRLAQGDRPAAAQAFAEALAYPRDHGIQSRYRLITPSPWAILGGLEEALSDDAAFAGFCASYRSAHPDMARPGSRDGLDRAQWQLEAETPQEFGQSHVHETFVAPPAEPWTWVNPLGDGSYAIAADGLAIRAANSRDFWESNLSAPRLVRPVSGDWAAQVTCRAAQPDRPMIGGLLLWKDAQHYLALERGRWGLNDVCLHGCLDNTDAVLGRGRLAGALVLLRLERIGRRVAALCSADGAQWRRVGACDFGDDGPVAVGVYAVGAIDRLITPGAYPDGTAIRFDTFELWRRA